MTFKRYFYILTFPNLSKLLEYELSYPLFHLKFKSRGNNHLKSKYVFDSIWPDTLWGIIQLTNLFVHFFSYSFLFYVFNGCGIIFIP